MSYLVVDLLNKPFLKLLERKIRLSKQLNGTEKSNLLDKVKNNQFIQNIKKHFNKVYFVEADLDSVLNFLKGV